MMALIYLPTVRQTKLDSFDAGEKVNFVATTKFPEVSEKDLDVYVE